MPLLWEQPGTSASPCLGLAGASGVLNYIFENTSRPPALHFLGLRILWFQVVLVVPGLNLQGGNGAERPCGFPPSDHIATGEYSN